MGFRCLYLNDDRAGGYWTNLDYYFFGVVLKILDGEKTFLKEKRGQIALSFLKYSDSLLPFGNIDHSV
jgi:hypothetical protein